MPSNRTFVVAIICLGLVTSIWLFSREGSVVGNLGPSVASGDGRPVINTASDNEWKNMLTGVNTTTEIVANLQNNSPEQPGDTTLTAQMSKDFMSQYLLAVRNNDSITSADAEQIARNTLNLPDYTKISAPVYVSSNLKVGSSSGSSAVSAYMTQMNRLLKDRSSKIQGDPEYIFQIAVANEDPDFLKKLDPIIVQNKGLISDMLAIEVPKSAVITHLKLLNAFSLTLSDLEAMRAGLDDPVRGLVGISQYPGHYQAVKTALRDLNLFFLEN